MYSVISLVNLLLKDKEMFIRKVGRVVSSWGRQSTLITKEGFRGSGTSIISGTEWSTIC